MGNTSPISIKFKILTALAVNIFLFSNLFIFGPYTIYAGNQTEFGLSLLSLLGIYLIPFLIITLTSSCICTILPLRLHQVLTVFLFGFGLCLWLQGNLFVWDYGIFGRGDLAYTIDDWRGWVDSSTWVILLVSTLIFHRRFYKIVRIGSLLFFSIQAIILLTNSIQNPTIWDDKLGSAKPEPPIYQLSKTKNINHVVLDELQSDIFFKIIQSDTSRYLHTFEGFTYYQDASGIYPTTIMSVPAFLTGHTYSPDQPIRDFIDTVYKGVSIPNELMNAGYEVDIAAGQVWYSWGRYTNWYFIPVPYGVAVDTFQAVNMHYMETLVSFRYSPHYFKNAILEFQTDSSFLYFQDPESYEALRHFSHGAFLQDLIDNLTVQREKPVYKLIHLTTTHWPAIYNSTCEYGGKLLPWIWPNVENQARCGLNHFIHYLEKLKSLGVYDSALIIIQADHGYWKINHSKDSVRLFNVNANIELDFKDIEDFGQKASSNSPLLLIKLPGDRGLMKVSTVQAQINDIPATISDHLKLKTRFPGRSLLSLSPNEKRARKYFYYYELVLPPLNRSNSYLSKTDQGRGKRYGKEETHRGRDHHEAPGSRRSLGKRPIDGRSLPTAGNQRTDVLQMA